MTGWSADVANPAGRGERSWLLIVDPQVIFADPTSAWCSPEFDAAAEAIDALVPAFEGRVLVTRWLPTADRAGSWGEYFAAWPFADVAASDPLYSLVPRAAAWSSLPTLDEPTFGKWGEGLRRVVGERPRLAVAGVSTDCCVLSTVLAAADGGAWVDVIADACAASTPENGAAALHAMGLYPPQVRVTDSRSLLAELGG